MTTKFLAAGSVALVGAGSFLAATPAQAYTTADCGTIPEGAFAAVLDGDVCSLTFIASSDTNWTVPSNIERLAAVLIGGGGLGSNQYGCGYGGGGGEVIYVSDVELADVVDISIGIGGNPIDSSDGGNTVFGPYAAAGGEAGYWPNGGYSGSDNASAGVGGDADYGVRGGGAKSAADGTDPGAGYAPNDPDLTENDAFFPEQPQMLPWGAGGDGACGSVVIPDRTGFGEGGAANGTDTLTGTDGAVIFRWAAVDTAEGLASTGIDANGIGMTAGVLGISGVALGIVAAARRSRRVK